MQNLKQITEILHTIFCRKPHEEDLGNYETSIKCCYYLEQSIEDTWECKFHKEWTEQAEFFISLSNTGVTPLEHMVTIYRAADALRKINPLFLKYVDKLINI